VFRLRVLAELISGRNFQADDAFRMNQSQLRAVKSELMEITADEKDTISSARLQKEVMRQKRLFHIS
jgi:hypothetical protein